MTASVKAPHLHAIAPAKQVAKRHYGSHPYFTKRAWNVVQAYIQQFTSPGDTVLDPFGGSGVTAVESLVLKRKAIYLDISEWACFLAKQTAIAPVHLPRLWEAFSFVEAQSRTYIEKVESLSERELDRLRVEDWHPKGIPLPSNADVSFVEELFTPRMLHSLARIRAAIAEVTDSLGRNLLLLAFSATLARINKTFLSARNRAESRGGSAIFSIYRYKVAKRPVELPVWDQFAKRFRRLIEAKTETNHEIGTFYREGQTARFEHHSATRLLEVVKPGSVDYIYTDPPYGAHISYLDLSTMWAAWLGFGIDLRDRAEEVIEGGQLKKPREVYQRLLGVALEQMHEALRIGGWMSIVFAHRDTQYWELLVDSCAKAGFRYVNTTVQPVGVVWSMHKKKNPLRVLAGELILNFRKSASHRKASRPKSGDDATEVVRTACEREIVSNLGASTEQLHHAVIPRLLETGLLTRFSKQTGDLTPLLGNLFEFDDDHGVWHLRENRRTLPSVPRAELIKYCVIRCLSRKRNAGGGTSEQEIERYVERYCQNGRVVSRSELRRILEGVAYSPRQHRWLLLGKDAQQEFCFA